MRLSEAECRRRVRRFVRHDQRSRLTGCPSPIMKSEAVVTKALSGLRRSALVAPSLTNKVMDGIANTSHPAPS